MSTTSSYSKNKLKEVIKNGTQHFITKSYIKAAFDYDRHITEYHLYWVNTNKGVFEDCNKYHCMSFKEMNKREKKHFMSILDDYKKSLENNHGCVWENKKLGFNKTLVLVKQLNLDI